jgi:hypothetical protein
MFAGFRLRWAVDVEQPELRPIPTQCHISAVVKSCARMAPEHPKAERTCIATPAVSQWADRARVANPFGSFGTILQFSRLARFSRAFAMHRPLAHRSHNFSKDRTRSSPETFDTFAIFECDQRVIVCSPCPALQSFAMAPPAPSSWARSPITRLQDGRFHHRQLQVDTSKQGVSSSTREP